LLGWSTNLQKIFHQRVPLHRLRTNFESCYGLPCSTIFFHREMQLNKNHKSLKAHAVIRACLLMLEAMIKVRSILKVVIILIVNV
jgi:hypothetical protein